MSMADDGRSKVMAKVGPMMSTERRVSELQARETWQGADYQSGSFDYLMFVSSSFSCLGDEFGLICAGGQYVSHLLFVIFTCSNPFSRSRSPRRRPGDQVSDCQCALRYVLTEQELGRMDLERDRSLRIPIRRCQAHLCEHNIYAKSPRIVC